VLGQVNGEMKYDWWSFKKFYLLIGEINLKHFCFFLNHPSVTFFFFFHHKKILLDKILTTKKASLSSGCWNIKIASKKK
jgi:hypothetical protein